jgi:hypothetical protein
MRRQIIGSLIVLPALFLGSTVHAETRYVVTTGANNDACSIVSPCRTFSHAVSIAAPGDSIDLGKGKFVEATGVVIDKSLTIVGNGTYSTRICCTFTGIPVLTIDWNIMVTITDLDVTDGNGDHGGGIVNHGELTLDNVRIRKNHSVAAAGIYNAGYLMMSRSEISNNIATGTPGGGLYGSAALSNVGYAQLDEVRIVRNFAEWGAAVTTTGDPDGAVTFSASRSEISLNSDDGIWNFGAMMLVNTTVSGNDQSGIRTAQGATTTLLHVTVAKNLVGLKTEAQTDVTLMNTIVADNTTQCSLNPFGAVLQVSGSLFEGSSCGAFWPGQAIVGVSPKLQPLKWNGGRTFTHALRKGSPAIDAANGTHCQPVDQRGVSRYVDGDGDGGAMCDIGAYEYVPFTRSWLIDQ